MLETLSFPFLPSSLLLCGPAADTALQDESEEKLYRYRVLQDDSRLAMLNAER